MIPSSLRCDVNESRQDGAPMEDEFIVQSALGRDRVNCSLVCSSPGECKSDSYRVGASNCNLPSKKV
jgi:hypothetical protein